MSDEEIKRWKEIIGGLEYITDIHIPRFVSNGPAQLLCFCDASKKLYATAIYLRNISDGTVDLLFSKARNAPKWETLTIPRLELLSLLIGVRSLLFVTKTLKVEVTGRILWTDSKCVLQWIKRGGNQSVFVRNRIKEITEKQDINFRYISTKDNPADLLTRGMSSKDLRDSRLWWHGPSWLSEDSQFWPMWNFPEKEYKDTIEESKAVVFEMAGISRERYELLTPFGIDELRYSSLTKLLNVTAYVQRFFDKIKKKQSSFGNLKRNEIQKAEKLWIKYVQQKHVMIKEGYITKELQNSQLNPNIHHQTTWKVTKCRHTR